MTPGLPTTFRPLWARRVIYPVAGILAASLLAAAILVPPSYQLPDRIGIVIVGLVGAYFLHRLADVRLHAERGGLTVVNIVRRHRLEWAQVLGARLGAGDPWLTLDLSDGETLPVMAIQGSDGSYAREQRARLAALVAAQSRTERDT